MKKLIIILSVLIISFVLILLNSIKLTNTQISNPSVPQKDKCFTLTTKIGSGGTNYLNISNEMYICRTDDALKLKKLKSRFLKRHPGSVKNKKILLTKPLSPQDFCNMVAVFSREDIEEITLPINHFEESLVYLFKDFRNLKKLNLSGNIRYGKPIIAIFKNDMPGLIIKYTADFTGIKCLQSKFTSMQNSLNQKEISLEGVLSINKSSVAKTEFIIRFKDKSSLPLKFKINSEKDRLYWNKRLWKLSGKNVMVVGKIKLFQPQITSQDADIYGTPTDFYIDVNYIHDKSVKKMEIISSIN